MDKTAANKKLVAAFVDDILVNGRLDRLAGYYDGDNYHQHNPQIADGLSGLGAALQAMAKAGVTMKYHKVHKVLRELTDKMVQMDKTVRKVLTEQQVLPELMEQLE